MALARVDDARAFREFLDRALSSGAGDLSLQDILDHWECDNAPDEEKQETIRAIQRGFDDIEAGRVRPARAALEEIRRRHQLPPLR